MLLIAYEYLIDYKHLKIYRYSIFVANKITFFLQRLHDSIPQ